LSPKTPVLALKIFLARPGAFPDKSGPTEPTQPVGGDLSPMAFAKAAQSLSYVIVRSIFRG